VLGHEVSITNVPGRGGGNGWDRLILSEGRADLAAVSSPTLLTNALLGDSSVHHRDLTSLAMLYTEHSALVVGRGSGLESPAGLLEALSNRAATVSFATALGNMNHLVLAEISGHLGAALDRVHIRVFESAPDALADVVAGSAEIAIVSAVSAVAGIGDGVVTPVMVTSLGRLGGVFAQTPTCTELGVPCVRGTWRGLVGPPGVGRDVVQSWSDVLSAAIQTEEWGGLLDENLWFDCYLGPGDAAAFLDEERAQLARLLEEVGLIGAVVDG